MTKQSIWIAAARFLLRRGYGGQVAHLAMTESRGYGQLAFAERLFEVGRVAPNAPAKAQFQETPL